MRWLARAARAAAAKAAGAVQAVRRRRPAPGVGVVARALLLAKLICYGTQRGAGARAAARGAAAVGSHLWMVNLAVNAAAAVWSLRFWTQTEAVSLCCALPTGGDQTRTIKVARHVIGRAIRELSTMETKMGQQEVQLEAMRAYVMAVGASSGATRCGGCAEPAGSADAEGTGGCEVALGECAVCLERSRDTALGCGHVVCGRCSVLCTACPFCREAINQRLRIWW